MTTAVLDGDRLIATADALAEGWHRNQVDKAGKPYIGHPRWVASHFTDPTTKAAALLHDVIEDVPGVNALALELEGMPPEVVSLVKVLTRGDDESYMEYVDRVCACDDDRAPLIKLFDLLHNTDPSRPPPASLVGRYHAALVKVATRLSRR